MQYTKLSEIICNLLRGWWQSFACVQVSLLSKSVCLYHQQSACSSMNKVLGCQWCVTATAWQLVTGVGWWQGMEQGAAWQLDKAWAPDPACHYPALPGQSAAQQSAVHDSCICRHSRQLTAGSCSQWAGMVCACSRCWADSCEQTEERSQSPVSPAATRTLYLPQCQIQDWGELLMLGSLDSGFYGNIKLDQAFLRRREETESTVTVSSPHKDNVRPRTLRTQSIDLTSSLVIYFWVCAGVRGNN